MRRYRGCDLIMRPYFEDIDLKEQVIAAIFQRAYSRFGPSTGSKHSPLPIVDLAESCPDPTRLSDCNFLSPVER